jgi:hypothetical protein
MTDKLQEEEFKCEKHDMPLFFYCDDDQCKKLYCQKCFGEENHENHKTYSLAVLKDKDFVKAIKSRNEELVELIEKLNEAEKDLKEYNKTCDTYKMEIETIEKTQIGRCLLGMGGKNKIQVVECCQNIIKSVQEYLEKIPKLIQDAKGCMKDLSLKYIINDKKTLDDSVLEKAVDAIGSNEISEGKDLLKKIAKDKIQDQLEAITAGLSETKPAAGKRKKPEKAEEESPKEEEKKPKKTKPAKVKKEEAPKKTKQKKAKKEKLEEEPEKEKEEEKPKKGRSPRKTPKEGKEVSPKK